MRRSWLIQRLRKPSDSTIVNAFAFGGGIKNGGLTDEAMKLVQQVCSVDYMGAAEFEFGIFQETLEKIVIDIKQFIAGSFKVDYRYDHRGWGEEPSKLYEGKKRVYYLCQKEDEEEVKARISKWAMKEPYGDTKESIALNMSMSDMPRESYQEIVGWLELDNGFMFFTDKKMWRGACKMFGVKTPSKKEVTKQ